MHRNYYSAVEKASLLDIIFNYFELSPSAEVMFGSGVGVGASGYFLKGC
jgi:hypothetical protein